MKRHSLFFAVLFWGVVCNAQKGSKCFLQDFIKLAGSWQGSLTYLDYSSGKPYTMAANVDIQQLGATNAFSFYNVYPKETNANSVDTVSLSSDGTHIGKELVKSRKVLNNGDIQLLPK